MSYHPYMTIHHQILTDQDGNPTAALIPWEEFQVIKAEMERNLPLDPETRAVLDRRSRELEDGTVEGIGTEEMFRRVQERLEKKRAETADA